MHVPLSQAATVVTERSTINTIILVAGKTYRDNNNEKKKGKKKEEGAAITTAPAYL